MSDWQIHSANASDMTTAVNFLGFTSGDGFRNGVRFTINIYGTKYAPTGNMVADPFGNMVPERTPLPGVYAILRWFSTTVPFPPPGVNIPSQITVVPLPADSPYRFA